MNIFISLIAIFLLILVCVELITHKDLAKTKIMSNTYVRKFLSFILNFKH